MFQKQGLDQTLCLEGTAGLWGRGRNLSGPLLTPSSYTWGDAEAKRGAAWGLGLGACSPWLALLSVGQILLLWPA